MQMHRSSLVLAILTACLVLWSMTANAERQRYSWQYATFITGNSALTIPVKNWIESWDQLTDDSVDVAFFFQEALLGATDILPGVRDGRVELGQTTTLYHPAETPLSQVVGIPFVTNDIEAMARALNELYETNEAFRSEWERQNIHVVSFVPIGGGVFGTSFPLEGVEDFRRRSIRSAGLTTIAVEEAGANPVAMPAPEIYEAAQRGILDGWSTNPFEVTIKLGWHEVTPYYTDGGTGVFNINALMMNKRVWDSLPEDLRTAINESREAYLREHVRYTIEQQAVACDMLIDGGGTPFVFHDDEVVKWKESVGDRAIGQWKNDTARRGVSEEVTAQFFEQLEDALRKYERTSSYDSNPLQRCVERASQ